VLASPPIRNVSVSPTTSQSTSYSGRDALRSLPVERRVVAAQRRGHRLDVVGRLVAGAPGARGARQERQRRADRPHRAGNAGGACARGASRAAMERICRRCTCSDGGMASYTSYEARADAVRAKELAATASPFTIEVRFLGGLNATQRRAF